MKGWEKIAALANQDRGCYISAIVLGLNDALVELTGALAGFTMALADNRLIVLAGFTTGVAATLSMAAAEFLSQKSRPKEGRAFSASIATGIAYLVTVAILLTPFFLIPRPLVALAVCMACGAGIIVCFTWFISRLRHTSFARECLQMLTINVCVAAISFCISWGARVLWHINV